METPLFTRLIQEYLSDTEYRKLQSALAADPRMGSMIRGSGGVRKMRWSVPGRGKRGGLRVIYYVKSRDNVIWMLTVYPKNVADTIPAHVLKQILREMENVDK